MSLLLAAFASAGCPQLLDDDFAKVEVDVVWGDGGSGAAPSRDAGAPDARASSGGGGGSGTGDGGVGGSDAGGAGAGGSGGIDAGGAGGAEADSGPPCTPTAELCDGVDNDCDDQVDQGAACSSECAGLVMQGHSYMYCGGQGEPQEAAEARCAAQGMHLVSIESAQENADILAAVAPLHEMLSSVEDVPASIWLAAQDVATEGTWRWGASGSIFWIGAVSGAPQDGAYQNWSAGKPNNNALPNGEDCAVLYLGAGDDGLGQWNDVVCEEVHAFLCEAG